MLHVKSKETKYRIVITVPASHKPVNIIQLNSNAKTVKSALREVEEYIKDNVNDTNRDIASRERWKNAKIITVYQKVWENEQ